MTGFGTTSWTEEKIDHPMHYGGKDNPYEVIKVLGAWLTRDEMIGFLKGNIIKYMARAEKKSPGCEDYDKAKWYLTYLVEYIRRSTRTPQYHENSGGGGGGGGGAASPGDTITYGSRGGGGTITPGSGGGSR